jgi:hypothetical protein
MTVTSIQSVCFSISAAAAGRWCGEDYRFLLTSPGGTTFTLYAGRSKNNKNDQGNVDLCFTDLASAVIYAPSTGAAVNIPSGSYLADGGSLSNAFVGQSPTGTWTLSVVDMASGGGTCGDGTPTLSNFCITFGVFRPLTYAWSGSPGSLSNTTISNPVYTPPTTNYSGTYTVLVTDANGCTGTGTVAVSCVLLPIELLNFYGEMGEYDNKLFWTTSSENNSNYFEVEKSTNGNNFYYIGKVKAQGNSVSLKDYDFIDKKRGNDINYYRLKMVDIDGVYVYSNIIVLQKNNKGVDMEITPNPGNNYINIMYNLEYQNESTITIYDGKGSIVEVYFENSKKGLNNKIINIEKYTRGVYNVVLNTNGTTVVKRFIK